MAALVLVAIAATGVWLVSSRPLPIRFRSLRTWLDECGFANVPVGVIVVVTIVLALTVGGLAAVVIPIPIVFPIAVIAGVAIPIAALDAARTRRAVLAESRWPDIIDSIRMAIRSGIPLHESLAAAEPQLPHEWRVSWNRAVVDLSRGGSVDSAIRAFRAERAEPIADRVCDALLLAHDVGGTELPRVLEQLARSIRDEIRIRREATSRQSWVRHAARLGSLAPWVVLVLLGSRPENRDAFASPAGSALLVGCAGATVVAYFVMTAMGRLPETPRWVTDA